MTRSNMTNFKTLKKIEMAFFENKLSHVVLSNMSTYLNSIEYYSPYTGTNVVFTYTAKFFVFSHNATIEHKLPFVVDCLPFHWNEGQTEVKKFNCPSVKNYFGLLKSFRDKKFWNVYVTLFQMIENELTRYRKGRPFITQCKKCKV